MTTVNDTDRVIHVTLNDGYNSNVFKVPMRVVQLVDILSHPVAATSRPPTPLDESPFTLSVLASGSKPVLYQWFRYDKDPITSPPSVIPALEDGIDELPRHACVHARYVNPACIVGGTSSKNLVAR